MCVENLHSTQSDLRPFAEVYQAACDDTWHGAEASCGAVYGLQRQRKKTINVQDVCSSRLAAVTGIGPCHSARRPCIYGRVDARGASLDNRRHNR